MQWLQGLGETITEIETAVTQLGASPWLIVAVFACCCLDAVFPVVPSDSLITAVTVLAVASGVSPVFLVLLVVAAATGAVLGDCLAYYVGTKVPVRKMPGLRRPRGQRVYRTAQQAFAKRGSTFVMSGRFVPVGRIVVNMIAGATGFPFRRFLSVAAVAGVLWAGIAAGLGVAAGQLLPDSALVAMLLGVGVGLGLGVVLDWVMQRRRAAAPSQADSDQPRLG